MNVVKALYTRVIDELGAAPSFQKDWRWVAFYILCIYAIVLAFRLSYAGRWDHPELWVAGERILATHDAYFWLAKAKGIGVMDPYPLAVATRLLHDWFGIPFGSIGFWGPAVVTSLTAIVCYLWGWLLAGRHAGIFAGLLGALTPGLYYRSRLGYYDTDMFTLLMPMLVIWLLAYWASAILKKGWFVAEDENSSNPSFNVLMIQAILFGLITRFAGLWHQDIVYLCVMYLFVVTLMILVNAVPNRRSEGLLGLVVYVLAAFPGAAYGQILFFPFAQLDNISGIHESVLSTYAGIGSACLLFALFSKLKKSGSSVINNHYICLLVLLVIFAVSGVLQKPIAAVITKILAYAESTSVPHISSMGEPGPLFPSIVQSIIEAKVVPLSEILERGAFSEWSGWLALGSLVIVVALRPLAGLLLPLVALHLMSVQLGVRFSMFGGASFMICLGVVLFWITQVVVKRFSWKKPALVCVQFLAGFIVLGLAYSWYGKLPLTPVVAKKHAEALIELSKNSPKDSMVWTWWDWGYATQYFAGLSTMNDGGNHSGRAAYPVAFVMSSHDIESANRMVGFSSQFRPQYQTTLGYVPAREWAKVPRSKIVSVLHEQLSRQYTVNEKQYFVVSWKDLTIAKWITYFGNWNLETGQTKDATISNYQAGQLGFNIERGAIMNRQGKGGLVSDITILSPEGVEKKEYYLNRMSPQLLPNAEHLVINSTTRQSVLMDRIGYRSTMRRLLTDDPNDPEISKYFKLVVDKLPFVRIYEVVQ